jgi:hypothetical protein
VIQRAFGTQLALEAGDGGLSIAGDEIGSIAMISAVTPKEPQT